MSRISLNSNVAALTAQRRFAQSTGLLEQSFVRLSSGLRINKASDDASGLAISADLDVDARVFNQGVRNINDAVGLLSVAESATQELSTVLIRQSELAQQAANGTLSSSQRSALDQEAQALSGEYNRILRATSFNNVTLLNGSVEHFRVQAGYGAHGGVEFSIGAGLQQTVGDGSFSTLGTFKAFSGSGIPADAGIADFNSDGHLDIATPHPTFGDVRLLLGNGDGSFRFEGNHYNVGTDPRSITVVDLNGDALDDLVTGDLTGQSVSVLLGNGDGTFKRGASFATPGLQPVKVLSGDFNNDGKADIVTQNLSSGYVSVLLGVGDGTFGPATTVDTTVHDLAVYDVNDDGRDDLVRGGGGSFDVRVLTSNGDGTFKTSAVFNLPHEGRGIGVGDFNGDGNADIIATGPSGNPATVLLGNGDGTYRVGATFAIGTAGDDVTITDLNGDGFLDVLFSGTTGPLLNVLRGTGDGSFQAVLTSSTGASNPAEHFVGDFNEDGALDVMTQFVGNTHFTMFLANTTTSGVAPVVDLSTRSGALAALTTLSDAIVGIGEELGRIGSIQSRLETAVSNLRVSIENVTAASSQITNADIAQESAELVRRQILQQSGAAVLAQANLGPQLALSLLQPR
ncbi:MAG: VCBS repeat-containing protein [Bdellovibrionales bacterium]|nr:VCBS repeat-containing protein [Bdellovibrionales bacterium]